MLAKQKKNRSRRALSSKSEKSEGTRGGDENNQDGEGNALMEGDLDEEFDDENDGKDDPESEEGLEMAKKYPIVSLVLVFIRKMKQRKSTPSRCKSALVWH